MAGPMYDVTVVMPVFNALPYLDEAIASILAQTLTDFRLAIYDDHSTDGSYERALEWAARDRRIGVTRGERRLGPCGSSNAAANLADSDFVARMDADDIAAPDRLAIQLEALRRDPSAVLVGSVFDMIDGAGHLIRSAALGQTVGDAPPIAHSSMLYRREVFDAVGGYRERTDYFEDLDLYRRMAAHGTLLVVDRPLIGLRFAGQHARLRDDREDVVERINLRHQPQGQTEPTAKGRTISPMAFYSIAVLAVLGLERPRLVGLMLRRLHFHLPAQTLAILGFVAVAEVSPHLARVINRMIGRFRAGPAGVRGAAPEVHAWTFRRT